MPSSAKESGVFHTAACNSNTNKHSADFADLKINVLAHLFGNLQASIQGMSNTPHRMVCLMEDFKSHLRTGCHNRIGAVGTVADNNILALVLLKLHVVLNLSRTITGS